MKKTVYVITGVIALALTGSVLAQQGGGRGMSSMDTDGNGTIEKSEFAAMFDKRFAETDANNDGISLDEYKAKSEADRAARNARRAERRAENSERDAERDAERLQKRFDGLDADNDGKVSADEYKAAGERMFDRMDRNNDGILNDRRDRGDRGNRRGNRRGSNDQKT
ncbi:MAG: hypothetical protein HOH19_13020 [Kordiimonadaceae bacterium]|mgnify:CR=1 FL=1|jgi:hypothetical protein|nr:hypothetical protein [Kordiimonadaceae bacterium]MBT6033491.1 hypothetical protein [Kordiimonadaceae bacterium]